MTKDIFLLGSTGSIGETTLKVIKKDKSNFNVKLLSTNKNAERIYKQAIQFGVKKVVIFDKKSYLNNFKKFKGKKIKIFLTIKEALKKNKLLFNIRKIKKGNPSNKIFNSKNYLKGNFTTGSQEHFYLEGQVCLVVPKEDNSLLVYSSLNTLQKLSRSLLRCLNKKAIQ